MLESEWAEPNIVDNVTCIHQRRHRSICAKSIMRCCWCSAQNTQLRSVAYLHRHSTPYLLSNLILLRISLLFLCFFTHRLWFTMEQKTKPVNVRTHILKLDKFFLLAAIDLAEFHLFVLCSQSFIPLILTIILCSFFSLVKKRLILLFYCLTFCRIDLLAFFSQQFFPRQFHDEPREYKRTFWSIVNIFMNNVCSINGCGQSE